MTERLYYENAYLTKFSAVVRACEFENGEYRVKLDKTAFYATAGGQPHDTGVLGGENVINVFADDAGDVWHALSAPLNVGAEVAGEIDWARRFDHMQQHAGEHMLASAVYRHLGGHTVGLHLGAEASTIDVIMPSGVMRVPEDTLDMLEDDVNARVQADVKIKCFFPSAETLAALPLRKAPAVSEHVRVVQIGEDEFCACGGTHPSSAGQVGLVKILDARPSRGKLRLTFVCGKRAYMDYRRCFKACERAAQALSTGFDKLPGAVGALLERVKEAEFSLMRHKRDSALSLAPGLLAGALDLAGARVVAHTFDNLGAEALRDVAAELVSHNNVAALLADESGNGCALLFARAAGVNIDMGALIKACARAHGGNGGGKADFARGEAASAEALDFALDKLKAGAQTAKGYLI